MLKFIYKDENYDYMGDGLGKQPYDIETEISVIENADISEVIQAMIRIMTIAQYNINRNNIIEAVKEAFDNR